MSDVKTCSTRCGRETKCPVSERDRCKVISRNQEQDCAATGHEDGSYNISLSTDNVEIPDKELISENCRDDIPTTKTIGCSSKDDCLSRPAQKLPPHLSDGPITTDIVGNVRISDKELVHENCRDEVPATIASSSSKDYHSRPAVKLAPHLTEEPPDPKETDTYKEVERGAHGVLQDFQSLEGNQTSQCNETDLVLTEMNDISDQSKECEILLESSQGEDKEGSHRSVVEGNNHSEDNILLLPEDDQLKVCQPVQDVCQTVQASVSDILEQPNDVPSTEYTPKTVIHMNVEKEIERYGVIENCTSTQVQDEGNTTLPVIESNTSARDDCEATSRRAKASPVHIVANSQIVNPPLNTASQDDSSLLSIRDEILHTLDPNWELDDPQTMDNSCYRDIYLDNASSENKDSTNLGTTGVKALSSHHSCQETQLLGLKELRICLKKLDDSLLFSYKAGEPSKSLSSKTEIADKMKAKLLIPFDHGWKRLLAMRSSIGKRKGDIYYIPPGDRKKLRSAREVLQYMKEHKIKRLPIDYFSFYPHPIYKEPYEKVLPKRKNEILGPPEQTLSKAKCSDFKTRVQPVIRSRPTRKSHTSNDLSRNNPSDLRNRFRFGHSQYRPFIAPNDNDTALYGPRTVSLLEDCIQPRECGRPRKHPKPNVVVHGDTKGSANKSPDEPVVGRKRGRARINARAGSPPHSGGESASKLTQSNGSTQSTVKMNLNKGLALVATNKDSIPAKRCKVRKSAEQQAPLQSICVGEATCVGITSNADHIAHEDSVDLNNLEKPCSLKCADMVGVAPTMYCSMCMVAVHPQCVNLSPDDRFTCKVCQPKDMVPVHESTDDYEQLSPVSSSAEECSLASEEIVNARPPSPVVMIEKLPVSQEAVVSEDDETCQHLTRSKTQALPIVIIPDGDSDDAEMVTKEPISSHSNKHQSRTVTSSHTKKQLVKTKKMSSPSGPSFASAACQIHWFHAGFSTLLQIFSLLPIQDFLKASLVCKLWRTVSLHPHLRGSLQLKGCFVSDWMKFSEYVVEHNVRNLDMQGVVNKKGCSNTWVMMRESLGTMCPLRELNLGICPVRTLDKVIDECVSLRSLSAIFMAPTELNLSSESAKENSDTADVYFNRLNRLRSLEKLNLTGNENLMTISNNKGESGDISIELPHLQSLRLTTWKMKVPHTFLENIPNLTVLQLGECLSWTEEHYKSLANLHQLEVLRLEHGQDTNQHGLAYSLKQLKRLKTLELIRFNVSLRMVTVLQALENLDVFCIWPDTYGSEMPFTNACTLTTISKMKYLKRFEWGVITNSPMEESNVIPFFGWSATRSSWKNMFDPLSMCDLVSVDGLASKVCNFLTETSISVFRVPRGSSIYPSNGSGKTIAQFRSAAGLQ